MSAQSPTSIFSSLYPRETAELQAIFKKFGIATGSASAVIDFPARLAESSRLQDDVGALVRRSRTRAGGPVSLSATLHLLLTAVGGPQAMQYGPEIDRPTALIESFLETIDGWPELSFASFDDAPAEEPAPVAPPRPVRSIAASLASHSALHESPWDQRSERPDSSLTEIARALARLEESYQRTALRLDAIDQRLADVDGHLSAAHPAPPLPLLTPAAGSSTSHPTAPELPALSRYPAELPDASGAPLRLAKPAAAPEQARLEPLPVEPPAATTSAPPPPAAAPHAPILSAPAAENSDDASPAVTGSFSSAGAQVRREDLRTTGYARFDSPTEAAAASAELAPHRLTDAPPEAAQPAPDHHVAADPAAPVAPQEAMAAWAELFASPPRQRRSVSVRAFVVLAVVLLLIAGGFALFLHFHDALLGGPGSEATAATDNVNPAPPLTAAQSTDPAAPATTSVDPARPNPAGSGNRVLGARESLKPSVSEETPHLQPTFVAASTMDSRLVSAPRPQQPRGPGFTGLSGMVVMEVVINSEGSVDDVRVLGGQRQLRDAAVNAIRNWRYKPVSRDGHNIPVRTIVRLDFNRNGNVTRSN